MTTASLRATANVPQRCLVCDGDYRPANLPGLLRCVVCGFVSADLALSDMAMQQLYGEDYFHGGEYRDYVAEEESLRINFRDRLATARPLVGNWSDTDIFEIGCAYGFFLSEASKSVRSARGIDICREAVDHAVREQHVCAEQGEYLDFDIGGRVDAIALWDTIEHLRRPDLVLRKVAADLKPGGLVLITTGDIDSLNARWRGPSWRMIHPPTHLHYFSVRTLSRLLERHGFEVVHVNHPGNSRNLRSMLHFILLRQRHRAHLYETLQSWPVWNLRLTLNLFDIMYVIGRRRVDLPKAAGIT